MLRKKCFSFNKFKVLDFDDLNISARACWAFASVALVESYYARKYNQLYSLSEQQLVDCNQPENYACDGGDQADG